MNHLKNYKKLITVLILVSTTPFLFLFSKVNFSLFFSNQSTFWNSFVLVFANVAGFIGAVLLFWQMILGSRFVTSKLTDDTVGMNLLHRWLGTYGTIFILIHPLLEAYNYTVSWWWLFTFNISNELEEHVTYGRIALLLFLLIWVTSAILRSKMKYRPWLYIHYLAYPLMGFVFIHALDLGSYLAEYLYLKVIWFSMITLFVWVVINRLAIFAGFGSVKYQLIDKKMVGENIVLLTLQPLRKKLSSTIGQHFYIKLKRLGVAHPFTIMEYDGVTGHLTFGIRMTGKFTKQLKDLPVGHLFYLEGPYGVFTREAQNNDPKVIIAGGIGITPFVQLVKKFGDNTVFFYCNRSLEDAVSRDELIRAVGKNYYDVINQHNRELSANIINGKMSAKHIIQVVGEQNVANRNYFICGSAKFVKSVEKILQSIGVAKSKIYYEELGF
ncbi:MAG: ferric reductase-like transmembrane domain-containing protein [Candidatus Buchananbacteria bacterium]|nr:ferric reductase-like transmembrane domain-containing protein [Candidatus Buchananbacteria bacterium]